MYTLTIDSKDKRLCLPINQESSGHLHLQFYSPNFMLAVYLHQDWDHGHPDAIKDEERKTKMWEENISKVINDLNHCKVCVAEHNSSPRPTMAVHMVEDNPGANEATTNPQTEKARHYNTMMTTREHLIATKADSKIKKALKKRMYTSPTKVNAGDWVYLKKNRDRYWNGPARVVQKDSKSLHCVIRKKPLTINKGGILLSKPDTFPVIEEESPIFTTTTQQLSDITTSEKSS